MKKIIILTRGASPYRVDFFNKLGVECDLTVCMEINKNKERTSSWLKKQASTYKQVYLKTKKFRKDVISFEFLKICKNDFDHIIINGYSTYTAMITIFILSMKKKEFIISVDGMIQRNDKGLKYFTKKFFLKKAAYILVPGEYSMSVLKYYGIDKNKLVHYPFTSINADEVVKGPTNQKEKELLKIKYNIMSEKNIISIGQFIHRKGYDVLLKAMKNISPNIGLYIVGGEPTKEYLDYVAENGLQNVHFVSFMNKNNLLEFFKCFDLFVLPTREDIWGLVVNEALSQGLPVVTTNKCVAGIELIKNSENGYIVPVENSQELANAITEMIALDRERIRQNCLNSIKEYTIEEMVKKHINFFSNI